LMLHQAHNRGRPEGAPLDAACICGNSIHIATAVVIELGG
jgi:hypothetical protein